jgi:hypothetical protein
MQSKRELSDPVVSFIHQWTNAVSNNPQVVLGEWLYAFGAMSALALKSHELTNEQMMDAVRYLNQCVNAVYKHADITPTKITMQ